MVKRNYMIYAENDDIVIAKSKGMNVSKEFRAWLKAKLHSKELKEKLTSDGVIDRMTTEKQEMLRRIQDLNEERNYYKREYLKYKERYDARHRPVLRNPRF